MQEQNNTVLPDIDINDERAVRLKKAHFLREKSHNPYPASANRSHTLCEAREAQVDTELMVAGRVLAMRDIGKLTFVVLQDESATLQAVLKKQDITEAVYNEFLQCVDNGDHIWVQGIRFDTKTGEPSVLVSEWKMLSKALRSLPDKFHGLKDKELRYRKRYLDLIMDRDVLARFKTRSRIIRIVREYLNDAGFTEVETPVLQVLYGGTNARPFTTHINAYNMPMYLRVAPELYLKRLVVGGFEKVYELGKNFRNEGVDQTHNPEFTMIEWYEAYTDYHGMMDRAEGLYKHIARELFGSLDVPVADEIISFEQSWPRIKMTDAIEQYVGIAVLDMTEKELLAFCASEHIEVRGAATKGQLIMEIFERKVTEHLKNPTWIIDYPKEVSPLSKVHRENPDFVERFECYVMGKEIGDGWSEIINPEVQRSRFENEQASMREGNDEAHPMDEEFIEALEHGMPPLGGIGIGIDRLVMLFTNEWSIRDVLLFPTMKPKNDASVSDEQE